jgi:hypothetical protein
MDAAPPLGSALPLPLDPLEGVGWVRFWLGYTPVKALLPLPLVAIMALPIAWFFRKTWKALDLEARAYQATLGDRRDLRPAVCLAVTAASLTLQEYYGGRGFYQSALRQSLARLSAGPYPWLRFELLDSLYAYGWWVAARVIGYVVLPLLVWRICFPKDRVCDLGLRFGGFFKHLWIYGLCLAFVIPALVVVAKQSDFGTYYPFYKQSSRSWFDLLAWEGMYALQFLSLEFFFRGWMVQSLRPSLGSAAVFIMAVPYCMIHYGKPYLEAHGAVIAGVVLGSLSAQTRSIYAGFLVHVTVALGMDLLALSQRGALPTVAWPPGW